MMHLCMHTTVKAVHYHIIKQLSASLVGKLSNSIAESPFSVPLPHTALQPPYSCIQVCNKHLIHICSLDISSDCSPVVWT